MRNGHQLHSFICFNYLSIACRNGIREHAPSVVELAKPLAYELPHRSALSTPLKIKIKKKQYSNHTPEPRFYHCTISESQIVLYPVTDRIFPVSDVRDSEVRRSGKGLHLRKETARGRNSVRRKTSNLQF